MKLAKNIIQIICLKIINYYNILKMKGIIMEEELMKLIDEQLEKNNALKKEIEEIDLQIEAHSKSIKDAEKILKNIKKDI